MPTVNYPNLLAGQKRPRIRHLRAEKPEHPVCGGAVFADDRFTSDPMKVTCRDCLALLKNGRW